MGKVVSCFDVLKLRIYWVCGRSSYNGLNVVVFFGRDIEWCFYCWWRIWTLEVYIKPVKTCYHYMTYITIKLALWFIARMYELRILVAFSNAWIMMTSNSSSHSILCIMRMILVGEGRVMSSIIVFSWSILSSYVCSKDFITLIFLFMHEENAMNRMKIDVIFMCNWRGHY